jgi:hypothetical protein
MRRSLIIFVAIFLSFLTISLSYADIYISVENKSKETTFAELGTHANVSDLVIRPCTSYGDEAKKADSSVEMVCSIDPDNYMFTHHVSRGAVLNGQAKVYLSFEKRPGEWCESDVKTFMDGVNVVSLAYPADFTCHNEDASHS